MRLCRAVLDRGSTVEDDAMVVDAALRVAAKALSATAVEEA